MSVVIRTVLLLIASNVLMTFAWYAHLKNLNDKPWFIAALISWGIAFFEYMFQVPANRLGATSLSVPQLKILQEVISLAFLFIKNTPFSKKQQRKGTQYEDTNHRTGIQNPGNGGTNPGAA